MREEIGNDIRPLRDPEGLNEPNRCLCGWEMEMRIGENGWEEVCNNSNHSKDISTKIRFNY